MLPVGVQNDLVDICQHYGGTYCLHLQNTLKMEVIRSSETLNFLPEHAELPLKGKYMQLKVQHIFETGSCRLLNEK